MNDARARRMPGASSCIVPLGAGYYSLALLTLTGVPAAVLFAGVYEATRSYVGAGAITLCAGLLVWSGYGRRRYETAKRALDIAGAFTGLVLFGPVMLLTALAVLVDSGTPVLFLQRRIGRYGAPFQIVKFRTMRNGAGAQWASERDERVTRIGAFLRRTSLDELPQFFNVLRGDMSLVGPRPEMESYAQSFGNSVPGYNRRHAVRPGITGYAQICARRDYEPSEIGEILALDCHYVDHRSLLMDVALIYRTALGLLLRRSVGR